MCVGFEILRVIPILNSLNYMNVKLKYAIGYQTYPGFTKPGYAPVSNKSKVDKFIENGEYFLDPSQVRKNKVNAKIMASNEISKERFKEKLRERDNLPSQKEFHVEKESMRQAKKEPETAKAMAK